MALHSIEFPVMLLVLALGLTLSSCQKKVEPQEEIRPVRVEKMSVTQLGLESGYSGEVRARYETPLAFRVPGKIVERKVEVGSLVKSGQVLAQLDTQDFALSKESAAAQLASARADYEFARADLSRYSELLSKRFISQAEFQKRQTAFDTAKARLEQIQAQLKQTQNQVRYTTLTSPEDGVITAIDGESGQVVSAGQVVMKLAQPSEKEVVIAIPESRLAEMRETDTIKISLWADQTKIYAGKIREISPNADPVTRTYSAKISILQASEAIKLGMTASVFLKDAVLRPAYVLPLTAIYQTNDQKPAVWVVDPTSSKVNLTPVQLGEYKENKATVMAGLRDGQLVVTAGVHKLFAGQVVKPLLAAAMP
jgi:RND family efflux transporter MFP subunit